MINELIKLATHLDKRGLAKEANYLDAVIRKIAESDPSTARAQLAKRLVRSLYFATDSDPLGGGAMGTDEDRIMNVLNSLKAAEGQHPGIAEEVANLWAARGEGTVYDVLKDEYTSESNPFNKPEEFVPVEALLRELGIA
jgi:hypothetical protein